MKRITEEEAKQFITCKDDYYGRDAVYYTLTPDIKDNKWEVVTYYTAKRKAEYLDKTGDGDSWVYILSNPSIPNLYKIGYTKDTPENRAKEVSKATGVPVQFIVEWAFRCFDGENLEYEVHKYLDKYRENSRREFFKITLEEAKEAIKFLGKNYTNIKY